MLGESLRERFGEQPEVAIRHEAVKLLASETRLGMLRHLDERRMTVSELSRAMGLNKSTVHEHLGKLVEGGLVRRDESPEREWVYYELTRTGKYVLRPSSARFVLMFSAAVLAGVVTLAFLHLLLVAGQGLALQTDDTAVPAGEANLWTVEVTRPGLLGFREPSGQADLYLLTADQAALFQLTHKVPAGAHELGPDDGLAEPAMGTFQFHATLAPGAHYVLARSSGGLPDGLLPILAQPVQVTPKQASLLRGLDPAAVDVEVAFSGEPVEAGLVRAVDQGGREVGAAPVVAGKAHVPLPDAAGAVRFEFRAAAAGSAFAPADGQVRAADPVVAFEPQEVPVRAPARLRVVVDDPTEGPRPGAPVRVERPDGSLVASGTTNEHGDGLVDLRVAEPGPLVVKAGDRVVGTLAAKPGLRVWLEPGPYAEGARVHGRTLLRGAEPQTVPGATVLLDGRPVAASDAKGEFTLQFGLGGDYQVEARKDGYLAERSTVQVPRAASAGPSFAGAMAMPSAQHGLARAAPEPALRLDAAPAVGRTVNVSGWVANPDSLPRVVRAELREDGRVVAESLVPVAAGGQAWATLPYAPSAPGPHALQLGDAPAQTVQVQGAGAPRQAPGLAPAGALAVAAAAALLARRR